MVLRFIMLTRNRFIRINFGKKTLQMIDFTEKDCILHNFFC